MSWLKSHWKKVLGISVGIVGAFTPLAPVLIPVGALVLGTDFQVGSQVGTPLGQAAKDVVRQVHGGK